MEKYRLNFDIDNPIFVSVSEAAKLGGVQDKTVRRALKTPNTPIKFKIIKDRYHIDLASFLSYLYKTKKLKNKLLNFGLGQYVKEWNEADKLTTTINYEILKKKFDNK